MPKLIPGQSLSRRRLFTYAVVWTQHAKILQITYHKAVLDACANIPEFAVQVGRLVELCEKRVDRLRRLLRKPCNIMQALTPERQILVAVQPPPPYPSAVRLSGRKHFRDEIESLVVERHSEKRIPSAAETDIVFDMPHIAVIRKQLEELHNGPVILE